ncbi:MAG: response regulator [Erythrobacter sp.]
MPGSFPKSRGNTQRPLRVLVVEDDAVLGLSIEQALTEDGFADVSICSSAECSLSMLRAEKFDAVVLDVHLADSSDGYEIAELIDAMGSEDTRIVFQTGAPNDIPDHIKELGPVLAKPYDPDALRQALEQKPRSGLLSLLRPR